MYFQVSLKGLVLRYGEKMKKYLQAKNKHHHVWAEYLRRWSSNGRDVHYTTAKGNIVCDSVKGLAMEKHFYQIEPLNDSHIKVIKGFSALSPDDNLQKLHMSYLNDFLLRQYLEQKYKQSGVELEDAEKILHATKCNMLEDLHSAHENEVQPIISALASRKLEILSDPKNLMLFVQFFGHQISRTKTFKDTCIAGISGSNSNTDISIAAIMDECWWFLSYMFGMNIGADLYATRKVDKHCLLVNDTETPFITSDQPIVNVHELLQHDVIKPPNDEQCDFYYPISPQVAYMINKSDRFQRGIVEVSNDIVNELNIKVARKANVSIISNSTDSLKPLLKYIGSHLTTVKSCVL
jgi:hypothetical protein